MKDKNKVHLVVLSGAGISAESGLKTFRDSGGLWEGFRVEEVATPEAWMENPGKVLEFYNQRRKAALEAEPNEAHKILAELEKFLDVQIITQNVDNLHERAGSSKVLHLHGELQLARSTKNLSLIYPISGSELNLGDRCELGSQLRPHIVWFGELVPNIDPATKLVADADIFLVIGTSLQVYPAAGITRYFNPGLPLYLIDPKPDNPILHEPLIHLQKSAVEGMKLLKEILLGENNHS